MHKYILWISRVLAVVALLITLPVILNDPTKLPEMIPFGICITVFCLVNELVLSKKEAKIRITIGNTVIWKIEKGHHIFTAVVAIICLTIVFLKYVLKMF